MGDVGKHEKKTIQKMDCASSAIKNGHAQSVPMSAPVI
jgi:hypothetical protein